MWKLFLTHYLIKPCISFLSVLHSNIYIILFEIKHLCLVAPYAHSSLQLELACLMPTIWCIHSFVNGRSSNTKHPFAWVLFCFCSRVGLLQLDYFYCSFGWSSDTSLEPLTHVNYLLNWKGLIIACWFWCIYSSTQLHECRSQLGWDL